MDAEINRYYRSMAERISTGIAQGKLPCLKQAIDADDTVQACIALHNAEGAQAQQEAGIDLAFALVGWIPGPGEASKQMLRAVNGQPGRFAPHLFDVLRNTLGRCRLKTSPEALLEGLFDAQALAAELPLIDSAVQASAAFQVLPASLQVTVRNVIRNAGEQLPQLFALAQERVGQWVRQQRNSAGLASGSQRPAQTEKPTPQNIHVKQVAKRPADGSAPTWLELNFHYANLEPVAHAPYRIVFADGSVMDGTLDAQGFARLENVPEGEAMIYYGEDPRPFVRPGIVTLDLAAQGLGAELEEIELDPDDLPVVAQYVTGRVT
ncbi:hypothetical protein KSS94_14470 [Pseudomonas fakonensis]|uniref:Uncharacterized protein n=1 Tax=Pseudomonas fakonensis TaxID=2842355 RepID=A0ABX8MY44_9PSED|nr:hypothetical protein [Pseudomonas fakonensis]QXH49161.1 hypothetical protein KSS94_14470 [Pseudomonas fakonensis]